MAIMSDDTRFPDAEQRAARKELLLARISTFLDTFVEGKNGCWPNVSRDDHQELFDICYEIRDLKFERDCDGEGVIEITMSDKAKYEVPWVPSFPRVGGLSSREEDVPLSVRLDQCKEYANSASTLVDVAKDFTNRAARNYERLMDELKGAVAFKEKIDGHQLDDLDELLSAASDDRKMLIEERKALIHGLMVDPENDVNMAEAKRELQRARRDFELGDPFADVRDIFNGHVIARRQKDKEAMGADKQKGN